MTAKSIIGLVVCAGLIAGLAPEPADAPAQTGAAARVEERLPPAGREPYINFSFDQVDVRFLVKLVGDITGRKFVIDKEIDSKITVVTPPQIPVSEVYPLFLTILEAAGCGVVERDGIYHIVARERRTTPVAPVIGAEETTPAEGLVTKVIRIENANAADLRKVLEPMVDGGKTGALGVLEASNHLIITDTAESIRRIEKIIAQIDKPGLARVTEVYPLRSANAQEMAGELNQAISGVAAKADSAAEKLRQRLPRPDGGATTLPSDAVVVAAPHSNSLILVGTPAQVADLKRIIEQMDTEPHTGHGRLKAIFLKYLSSEQAAKSLTALFGKSTDKTQAQRIAIESSLASNALLVDAAPQDFEMVRELVEQLDQPPQQVLVEVIFAEISGEEGSDIGVEFMAGGTPGQGSTIALGGMKTGDEADTLAANVMQGIVPNGLTFGVAKGGYTDSSGKVVPYFPALLNINAIQKNSKFKIVSNIPLWTQNNQQANVTIGKNIPILKSTVSAGAGTARDYIENIDRIDVGIKLTVTPHVNPNGEVLMTLNPSLEAVIEASTGGKAFTPTIAKREVTTTITIPDGATIIISGLIREDTTKKVRKIPYLGSLPPPLGWLFRRTEDSVEKTNLLIFVTPHVVSSAAEAAELTSAAQARSGIDTGLVGNVQIQPQGE